MAYLQYISLALIVKHLYIGKLNYLKIVYDHIPTIQFFYIYTSLSHLALVFTFITDTVWFSKKPSSVSI